MSIEQLEQFIDESEPIFCITTSCLNRPRVIFASCYLLIIILTVVAVSLRFYDINVVGDRDFIIDTQENEAVRNYEMLRLVERSLSSYLPSQWQLLPAKMNLGDNIELIYERD